MQPIIFISKLKKIKCLPSQKDGPKHDQTWIYILSESRRESNVMKQLILARRANVLNAKRTSLSSQRRPATSARSGKPSLNKFGTDLAFRHLEFRNGFKYVRKQTFSFYLNLDRLAILKHKILPHQYIFHFCLCLSQFQLVFLVEFEAWKTSVLLRLCLWEIALSFLPYSLELG